MKKIYKHRFSPKLPFLFVDEAYQLGEAHIAEGIQVTLSLNRKKIIAVDR